jgi:type III secretion protein J
MLFGVLLLAALSMVGVLGWQHWQRRASRALYELEDVK